ncbi:MAG: 4-(cytidine 5'-diphospho)-2-C-methyl-D-erythritol kinase [Spirochaetaceae bacterium]|jgi:4-diphosphocytidyl-2-C-methyl-D-erythritol kinase|nr:4-(cytidine 5'-diphospho)-2-C-methyl-D-erythritol kinase [Spirochaetaceae bacterium]
MLRILWRNRDSAGKAIYFGELIRKKIRAPAKINLHLSVGAKRPDGFHAIESVFVPVSLYDTIDFQLSPRFEFSVAITGMDGVPLEKNLMYKAARLFHEKTGLGFSLNIGIEKNIPQGAGLGGGSSNAAAILNMLNEASGTPLPCGALLDMAARIGSDVPFFIEGKPAWVTGRGETLTPFELKNPLFFVLVKPLFDSGTAEAYRLLDAARSRRENGGNGQKTLSPATLTAALGKPPAQWPFHNDFQDVFLDGRCPCSGEYRQLLSDLRESGAPFSALSGSGSAVFGVYESENAAAHAAARLQNQHPFVHACATCRGGETGAA